ncbi:hypothetical protein ACIBQ1_14195 [Nonomuraea sp. NPDC050153]|uniref:hypothetical protein n=1 Tax=Nonomuraea sp. NPDC050153 TaxID=3364359 RepID=UPI0037AD860A
MANPAKGPGAAHGFWAMIIAWIEHRDRMSERDYKIKRNEGHDQAVAEHLTRLSEDVIEYVAEDVDGNRRTFVRRTPLSASSDTHKVIVIHPGGPSIDVARTGNTAQESERGA